MNEDESLESVVVAGVTSDKNEAKVTVRRVEDKPGRAAGLFVALAEARISVDMIIQTPAPDGSTDMTFTVSKGELGPAREIAGKVFPGHDLFVREDVVKVSIVGLGMRSHAGVAAKMFRILADERINIEAITTSEIKVSCLVAAKYHELAVRSLHHGSGLCSCARWARFLATTLTRKASSTATPTRSVKPYSTIFEAPTTPCA